MIVGGSLSWMVWRVNWEAEASNLSCLSPDYTFCTTEYPRVRVTKAVSMHMLCVDTLGPPLDASLFVAVVCTLHTSLEAAFSLCSSWHFKLRWHEHNGSSGQIILLTLLSGQSVCKWALCDVTRGHDITTAVTTMGRLIRIVMREIQHSIRFCTCADGCKQRANDTIVESPITLWCRQTPNDTAAAHHLSIRSWTKPRAQTSRVTINETLTFKKHT